MRSGPGNLGELPANLEVRSKRTSSAFLFLPISYYSGTNSGVRTKQYVSILAGKMLQEIRVAMIMCNVILSWASNYYSEGACIAEKALLFFYVSSRHVKRKSDRLHTG